MLNSHNDSSLNDYQGIPFPRLINNCFVRSVGKRNKHNLWNNAGELSNKVHFSRLYFPENNAKIIISFREIKKDRLK